jgi:hypothetical protein
MRQPAPIVPGPAITLRRHPLAALPLIMIRAFIGVFLAAMGIAHSSPILLMIGLLAGSVMAGYALHAWRVYAVSVRYDRILVRQLRRGRIQQDLYPIPGLRGLMRRQSILSQAFDLGTIIIHLPDRTLRLTMLAPYSAIATVFGFDCLP